MDKHQRETRGALLEAAKKAGFEPVELVHYSKLTGEARINFAERRREINLYVYDPQRLSSKEQTSQIGADYRLIHKAYEIMNPEQILSCEKQSDTHQRMQSEQRDKDTIEFEKRSKNNSNSPKNIRASTAA